MFIDFYLRKSPAGIKVSACTFTEWGPGWMRTASPQRDEGRIATGKRGGSRTSQKRASHMAGGIWVGQGSGPTPKDFCDTAEPTFPET